MQKDKTDSLNNDNMANLERLYRQMKREHDAWTKLINNIENLRKKQINPSKENE